MNSLMADILINLYLCTLPKRPQGGEATSGSKATALELDSACLPRIAKPAAHDEQLHGRKQCQQNALGGEERHHSRKRAFNRCNTVISMEQPFEKIKRQRNKMKRHEDQDEMLEQLA